ncbi:LuxR C-terminal-related transcriptional regulator [Streptomyces longispororuber]|uniref:LuxR C-terminal-related transcriptional regulator n=1 Tax=Streptomyces longispororuber TaxID=68230 RepID=UPI00210CC544|nr:LuxR C-terminal-related transcriptional regulator [Streptomyces longispororuber]MCQ4212413.1 LuxR C-terminal-related transcriptional regulator [Streptomyces longispororuber]
MLDSPFRLRLPPVLSAVRVCRNSACGTAGLCESSFAAWADGDLEEGIRLAAAAVHAEAECGGNCRELARIWHATLLIGVRDLSAAARVLADVDEPAAARAEEGGLVAASLLCAADLAFAEGNVTRAVALADRGVERARRAGLHRIVPDAHTVMALGALRQGSMSVSTGFANQLRDCALLGQTAHRPSQCAWAAAQLLEVQGGAASAAHLVVGIVTDDRLLLELLASQPAAAAWLVRATRQLGDEGLARRVAATATELAGRNPALRSVTAAAAHAAGLVDRDPERVLAAAAAQLDPWAAASAFEDAGKLCAARPAERQRAVEALESAADGYGNAGAPRDARRVVSRLRSLGVRRGCYPQYAGQGGVTTSALTHTEAAVAELVSQGFTNSQVGDRMFISGHTVAFHLKKIFRKMNVASRVELTRAWSQLSGAAAGGAAVR